MHYIQFYRRSAVDPLKLVEAVGDRSVIIVDGREREAAHHATAMHEQEKRGYHAYRLMKGETFTSATALTDVYMSLDMLREGCRARKAWTRLAPITTHTQGT